mgnify:CR=1 FL=1
MIVFVFKKQRVAVSIIALLVSMNVLASSPEYIESDSIDSKVDNHSPLDYGFHSPVVLKKYREKLDGVSSFRRDSALTLNMRNYSFYRNYDNAVDVKTSALGGGLQYTTGWYRDFLQFESSLYTSQKLYGSSRYASSGLLQPNQQGYSVLGKANAKLRYRKSLLTLYRSELNTPFANQNDIRMTPLLFESYSLLSKDINNVDLFAAVVKKYKPVNAVRFQSMLKNIDSGNNNPLYILGARYHLADQFSGGVMAYRVDDYLDIGYVEYQWNQQWHDYRIGLSQQYIQQRSNGREVGGDISSHAWGAKLDIEFDSWLWTVAWHDVTGDKMRSDWGSYPGYNSMMVKDFNRADETSWRLGFRYDMQVLLKGLSVFGSYIQGDTPERGKYRSSDESEFDLTLNYSVQNRFLKDMNIRLRYANVNQDFKEGSGNLEDLRLIINYQLPLF